MRQFNKALSGLWQRRHNPVVQEIVDEALAAAEQWLTKPVPCLNAQGEALWFGRFTPDLHILTMNSPPREYIGVSQSEMFGRSLVDLISKQNADILREAFSQAIECGQAVETFAHDREGRPMVVHVRPVVRDGNLEILAYAHRAGYRLFQFAPPPRMVGEP